MVAPWPTPHPELLVETFDTDLITVNPKGLMARSGQVSLAPRELVLSTVPRSQPTVHLLTAEVPFAAVFSVSVLERSPANVFPFQVKVWNPRADVAVEAWYVPDGTIMAGMRTNERWWLTRQLGEYRQGKTKVWRVGRDSERVVIEVREQSQQAAFEITRARFPSLFEQETLSLTVYASASIGGSSRTVVRDPLLSVPSQTRYGTGVQSPWFRPVVSLAVFFSLLWLIEESRRRLARFASGLISVNWLAKGRYRELVIVLILAGVCMFLGWGLSRVPGHPLDTRTVAVWSNIARKFGISAVPERSLLATAGQALGGEPYASLVYPYPPILTYLFWTVGKVAPAERFEETFKMLTTLGVAAGGGVLFALLRRLKVSAALATYAMGAYVLNPAVLFDSAVWGQTDSFVACFLLVGAAGIFLDSAPLIWTGALLALLTKQTGIAFAPVIIALGLAKLGLRQLIKALPSAIMVIFLVLSPAFLAGIHPSAIYRPVVAKVLGWGTIRHMEVANALVAQNSFTLWSALASLVEPRPWSWLAFPDFIPSRFGGSYFVLSRATFALFVLLLGVLFLRRKHATLGVIFLTLAAYEVGVAVLLTRILPRYFYFGVMFVAASLPWLSKKVGLTVLATITGTMLVSMWGTLALIAGWYPGLLSAFEPHRSWLNAAAATALSRIGLITGGFLNLAVLLVLLMALANSKSRVEEIHGNNRKTENTQIENP